MSASSYLNKELIDCIEIINQARADMISSHVRTFLSHYAYLEQDLNVQPVAKGNVFWEVSTSQITRRKSDFIVIRL